MWGNCSRSFHLWTVHPSSFYSLRKICVVLSEPNFLHPYLSGPSVCRLKCCCSFAAFKAPVRIGVIFKHLRKLMDSLLEKKLENPRMNLEGKRRRHNITVMSWIWFVPLPLLQMTQPSRWFWTWSNQSMLCDFKPTQENVHVISDTIKHRTRLSWKSPELLSCACFRMFIVYSWSSTYKMSCIGKCTVNFWQFSTCVNMEALDAFFF